MHIILTRGQCLGIPFKQSNQTISSFVLSSMFVLNTALSLSQITVHAKVKKDYYQYWPTKTHSTVLMEIFAYQIELDPVAIDFCRAEELVSIVISTRHLSAFHQVSSRSISRIPVCSKDTRCPWKSHVIFTKGFRTSSQDGVCCYSCLGFIFLIRNMKTKLYIGWYLLQNPSESRIKNENIGTLGENVLTL